MEAFLRNSGKKMESLKIEEIAQNFLQINEYQKKKNPRFFHFIVSFKCIKNEKKVN